MDDGQAESWQQAAPGLAVLSNACNSLEHLLHTYTQNTAMTERLSKSIKTILRTAQSGGKVTVTGVGKSGIIGRKLVATCNSFGLPSCFLHPTEALHGDLGLLQQNDVLIIVTKSGRTPEIESLLNHISPALPIIAICGTPGDELAAWTRSGQTLVLEAIGKDHVPGDVPAPTASALAALALGDAIVIAVAVARFNNKLEEIFLRNHPGGSIGKSESGLKARKALSKL